MNFTVIALLYAPKRLDQALRVARFLVDQARAQRCLFVLNGTEIDAAQVRSQWPSRLPAEFLQHDNTGAEFGGYQLALDQLRGSTPDRLIVLNDTVGSHDLTSNALLVGFLRRLRFELNRFVVGKIGMTHRRMRIDGLIASRWIRSHLIGMDRDALESLDCRFYHPHLNDLVRASPVMEQFFDESLQGGIRELLHDFLFVPKPWSWYGAEPLSETNCEFMANKARAILQEKYLSMKLEACDTAFWEPYLESHEVLKHRGTQVWRAFARQLRKG
jgi:hypothetical protein